MNDPQAEKHAWIAAFLLVIPGFTLIGAGVGLALEAPGPWTTAGLGAGLAAWGLIVALRRRS
jgi:hypothetical protein